jgi:hypothetical protein
VHDRFTVPARLPPCTTWTAREVISIVDSYAFEAEIWVAPSTGAWHFVSLPNHQSDEILERSGPSGPGFESVRVTASIGESRWNTSIFPDSKRGTYVLPVKKAVRTAEGLAEGDLVNVVLDLRAGDS